MLGKIVKLEEQNQEQQTSIKFICKENDDLKKELNDLRSQITTTQTKFQAFEIAQGRQQTKLNDVKQQTQSSDLRQRKLNLIFDGLPEEKNEFVKETIFKIVIFSMMFPKLTQHTDWANSHLNHLVPSLYLSKIKWIKIWYCI